MKKLLDSLILKNHSDLIDLNKGYWVTIYAPNRSYRFLDNCIKNVKVHTHTNSCVFPCKTEDYLFDIMESIYVDPLNGDTFAIKVNNKFFTFIKAMLSKEKQSLIY